ncbi:Uncharacterized protein Fot_15243 [Forsythia ovata]|uniref:Maturase K n=1 Tax=Forsythia ovata TaxID=205694 RepID=A0ABD1W939_9LAMI
MDEYDDLSCSGYGFRIDALNKTRRRSFERKFYLKLTIKFLRNLHVNFRIGKVSLIHATEVFLEHMEMRLLDLFASLRYNVVQLGSSLGKKRPSSDSRSSLAKKFRTGVSSGPPLVELFRTQLEGLQSSTVVCSLPNFLSRCCSLLFGASNKARKDFSTTMTAR